MKTRYLMVTLCLASASLLNLPAWSQSSKIDAKFSYLHQEAWARGTLDEPLAATIRFTREPSQEILAALEGYGVQFHYYKDRRLGSATVFPVQLRFDVLDVLESVEAIASVQPSWRPVRMPPLDVSRPAIQADSAWQRNDQLGRKVTGKGVLIADFDTGVDFFHPLLWFADGDTLSWLDVNTNSTFDPGTDAVDLNHNNVPDAGEILRYREISYSANTSGVYDANLDFLYNDANGNGSRDFGTGAGFTESSPTYGEQWFICLDANQNNRLNVGERLVGLRTSKIRAIREANGTVRRRGVDLINASPDTGPYGGHGTSVAGIAVGGVPGVHRLAGVAPGAEMIFGSINYNNAPRFFTELAVLMAWAAADSADVMLVEDGEWVWEYLDGSSNEEVMINDLAAAGVAQIMPAGNLTGGWMQKTITVGANDSTTATFTGGSSSQVWPSLRWLGNAGDVAIRLQVGASAFVTLPGDGSTLLIGGKSVYSLKSTSSRGTVMMMIYVASSGSATYNVRVVNTTATAKVVEGMLGDNGFSWSGLARWSSPTENHTVTWPATADSAIGVAAYKNKSSDTDINSFSGRGSRIDGRRSVDVAAPGSTVYTMGRNTTYTAFGGTSSAGPHVAGSVALLRQADTTLTAGGVRRLLHLGAIADGFTGAVPNTTWGFGKLRVANSLSHITTSVPVETFPNELHLAQNYPNPFNPSTTISFTTLQPAFVALRVYNVLGQEVATLVNEQIQPGNHTVTWNASGFSSGVYYYRLVGGGFSATRAMVLVK